MINRYHILVQHKLPLPIIDIIQQHYGAIFVYDFYHKAKCDLLLSIDTKNMFDDDINMFITNKLDASIFRYNGPRPRTKENVIVMLSDSVESASRSLQRVTHQSIEELTNMIFDIKCNNHQFDECLITLNKSKELPRIFASIVLSLTYSRISYNISDSADDINIS
jgi:membrane-associated HD superfamily phosphohydrolase